ncbi:MAG: endonuclease/exonuclease/phosphatase family protein, partial [Pseudonocardiaceae bacterium]
STALRAGADLALDGAGADHAVVVAGDLNDETEAATTQILLGPGGSEIGTPGFDRPDKGDATRLWNLAPKIPEAERYSRVYQGRNELIDHILVSKAILDKVTAVSAGSAKLGQTPSVNDDPKSRKDKPGSDHRPVVADFEL